MRSKESLTILARWQRAKKEIRMMECAFFKFHLHLQQKRKTKELSSVIAVASPSPKYYVVRLKTNEVALFLTTVSLVNGFCRRKLRNLALNHQRKRQDAVIAILITWQACLQLVVFFFFLTINHFIYLFFS